MFRYVSFINLMLCLLIILMGYIGYKRTKVNTYLQIGLSFSLFALSHFIEFVGLVSRWAIFIVIIRIVAYLIVAFILQSKIVDKKEDNKSE